MDREISKEVKRGRLRRRLAIGGGAAAAVALAWWLAAALSVDTVNISELKLAEADRGDVDATLTGNGTVSPAFEEVINSPIASRVVEVYHRPGDVVEAGTPLLRLDLEASQTAYRSESDKLAQLRLQLAQLRANNRTRLSDLAKQIEVARMKLRRYDAEYINERYLDSIGSGTGDRVREVELTRNSARLELEQLQEQLKNETEVKRADEQLKLLEIEIQERQLAQQGRTLDDAEIRAPRRATVTSIADKLGATVGAGQQVAAVADLGHYRIDATLSENNAPEVKTGSRVWVRAGRETLGGMVSGMSPTAVNGLITVSVTLDNDSAAVLRPGVKAEVKISSGLRADVVRVPNLSYYTGPGAYQLYVLPAGSDELNLRSVRLGAAGYDYVEVISGLTPGDRIVANDTKRFENAPMIKVKNNK